MALGGNTFSALGGAVNDLFSADAFRTRAKGNRIQAQEYDLASDLALKNKQFTETSTAIKQMQTQRGINMTLGQQQADVASSGFTDGGTALDLMRDSAAQGALHKAVLSQQGLIEEAGFEESAKSYQLMASSARMAADADDKAVTGAYISAAFKGAVAVASLFTGGQTFGAEDVADNAKGIGGG